MPPKANAELEDESFECTRCGRRVPSNRKKCPHCGLEFYPSDNSETETENLFSQEEAKYEPYPALRTVGSIYGILGWVTLVGSVILGLFLGGTALNDGGFLMAFINFGRSVLTGAIVALPMLAAQDIIKLLVALE